MIDIGSVLADDAEAPQVAEGLRATAGEEMIQTHANHR